MLIIPTTYNAMYIEYDLVGASMSQGRPFRPNTFRCGTIRDSTSAAYSGKQIELWQIAASTDIQCLDYSQI